MMHWESYYVKPNDVFGRELIISGDEAHHLLRVKRKKKGDRIWAVDGEGGAYEAEVLNSMKNKIICRIITKRRRIAEPVVDLTLAQGVMKGDRFDLVVQKATEIGVKKIIPTVTERTEVKPGKNKVARWRKIAKSAMKQCGRCYLPEVTEEQPLQQVLTRGLDYNFRYISHLATDSMSLSVCCSSPNISSCRVIIAVGPEGGFSDDELESAKQQEFQQVTLGPRRLRAETAGIVLTTIVLFQLGELE